MRTRFSLVSSGHKTLQNAPILDKKTAYKPIPDTLPGENAIRAGALAGWIGLVEGLGGEPAALAREQRLPLAHLSDPDRMIPYSLFERFLAGSATHLGCTDFGMRLGCAQHVSMLGPVGLLMARCASMREALAIGQRYMSLHALDEHWRLVLAGRNVALRRYQYQNYIDDDRQTRELSLAAAKTVIFALGGRRALPRSVSFTHAAQSSADVYRRHLHVRPRFNREFDQLVYPRSVLDLPLRPLSVVALGSIERELREHLAAQGRDPIRRLRWLLSQIQASPGITIDDAAGMLHISVRTLQRRLTGQGLDFRSLLGESRCASAARLLRNSEASVTMIAGAVGYTNVCAFSRAFSQRYGRSPRSYRQDQGSRYSQAMMG